MENKNNNVAFTKRKVLSLVCLIIFSLAFIFACLKNVLPLGKWIVSTFGIMTYPLFLFFALIELAKFLGLRYKRSVKSTVYAIMVVVSLLFVIQAITTYKQLDKVATFNSFKTYLDYSYGSKITLVGSFGSIFVGGLSIFLGAMGTIVAFVILLTISIGLIVDYENYGKFDDEKIKKLKTKSLREKVNNSDKDAKDGKPSYGFDEENDVVGTLEVNENDLNYTNSTTTQAPSYSDDDVVGEVSSSDYSYQPQEDDDYQSTYSHNPFSNQDEENLNQSRREFMGGTFGGFSGYNQSNEQTESSETDNSEDLTTNYNDSFTNLGEISTFGESSTFGGSTDVWGTPTNQNEIKIDDNVKNILSKEEVDVSGFGNNNFDDEKESGFGFESIEKPNSNFDTNFGQNANNNSFGGNLSSANAGLSENQNFGSIYDPKPIEQPNVSVSQTNNVFGFGTDNIKKRNEGILTGVQTTQKPEQKKPVVPSGNQIPMQGVRYNPPPLSLLTRPVKDNGNYTEEQTRKSKQLEEVLASFNVPAKVVNIVRGPKITRYELSMPLGVSVKKIPNYELDIQSALAAKTITIQAPIPGSNLIGIELENDTFTSVYERELFESPEFQNAKGPLPIAIGKDISGSIIVKSLAKMVHVLIAGSTGSGKSVFIHNIVLSLIYKYSPEDLRLVMVDPKRVEFGFYNGLPHLVSPEVVLGTEKAVSALKWCVKEMDRRFEIMGRANYKNIEDYNKSELVKSGQFEHFPYIVIIVDELAEIMTLYKKEAETALQRLTQLARACGMHLVVAVQRPSVDIITGVIKNNISSRFAFRLQSGFDSKTMLGTNGAEKLLGQGDMLMSLTDSSAMPRLQAAYASDDEIKAVVDFVKRNNPSHFDENAEKAFNSDPQAPDDAGAGDFSFADAPQSKGKVDEYFKIAVKSVMMCGSASVSYLQRRLSIGYSRAARIIDQMEEKGYIAPPTGSKTRKVLITPEQFREDFGEEYNS